MARPFLKWAGGKRQLIQEIESRLPSDFDICKSYIEPFVGGGAVLFHLLEKRTFEEVHISDANPELILCYRVIKSDAKLVSKHLSNMIDSYPANLNDRKIQYYTMRDDWNCHVGLLSKLSKNQKAIRVAQTIFLNKTCFNGLFRVNRKGEFNVPIGSYDSPSFPSLDELLEVQKTLKSVHIHLASFERCEKWADESSLIYFDPPYRRINKSSFVSYSKDDFGDKEQIKLAKLFKRLDEKGSKLILSNSYNGDDFFIDLFIDYEINFVKARRSINSIGNGRGQIDELLIRNYK
jgi:DNA adenine methylase